MRPLYKIRFQIEPKAPTPPSTIAETCLAYVEDWVETSHLKGSVTSPGIRKTSEIDPSSDEPQIRSSLLEAGAFFHSFAWRKRDGGAAGNRWVTLIDLISDGESVDFQLELGVESPSLALETDRQKPARPRLIATLLSHPEWDCKSGDQTLSVLPTVVTLAGIESFCNEVLFAPGRNLPSVVATPSGNSPRPPVNTQKLAERLAGSARVYRVRDRIAGQVLDQYLGSQLAIGPDAVRVFAAGLEPGSTVDGHWHLLGRTIRDKGLTDMEFADFLFGRLAERALARFRDSPLVGRFRDLAAQERARKLEELRAAQRSDRDFYEAYSKDLETANRNLDTTVLGLRATLQDKDARIESLQAELDAARENIRTLTASLSQRAEAVHEPPPPPPESPSTVAEAVAKAKREFKDLVFLPSALEAADDVPITYKFVDRVMATLEALQEGAAQRNRGDGRIAGGWKAYFEKQGIEYKPRLSDTTRNTWGDDYRFLYERARVMFEEHFTIGVKSANTCISIHFSTELRKDKIVVAYVGRHLRNTQS